MPEITDEQWAQALNLDAFTRRALANPVTRKKILEVQKELNPEVAIPEIDAANPITERIDALEKRWEEREKERTDKEVNDGLMTKWNAGKAAAVKRGFTGEGLEKLEDFMHQHGIAEHEAAIPYYEQLHPPPQPAMSSSSKWDFFGQQPDNTLDLKLLYEGRDDEWLNTTVADTLQKVRSGEITR